MLGEPDCQGETADVLVVGAGAAGLAAAAMVKRRGLSVQVLEAGKQIGSSWRNRYDGLTLNTVRWLSSQPGLRVPRRHGRWVARDDFVSYLEGYASFHGIAVECATPVTRIDRDEEWSLVTPRGIRSARSVVVATGRYHTPRAPQWPGAAGFTGRILHAADYRSAAEMAGTDVLVVGAGNSGTEIAQQLARGGARRVALSVRTPPNIVPRELLGMPLHPLSLLSRPLPPGLLDRSARLASRLSYGDLAGYGLPFPADGVHTTSNRQRPPVIDSGFVDVVKEGGIEVVPAVTAVDGARVGLADGSELRPDIIIAAIGYETGLEDLVGHLGILDDTGVPVVCAPSFHPQAPDLYFVGYRAKLGGFLVDIGWEARRTAKAIARRHLQPAQAPSQAK